MNQTQIDDMYASAAPGGHKRYLLLLVLLLTALLVLVGCGVSNPQSPRDAELQSLVSEQGRLARRIATLAAEVAYGSSESLRTFRLVSGEFERNLKQLETDASQSRSPGPQGGERSERIAEVVSLSRRFHETSQLVDRTGPVIIKLREIFDALNDDSPRMAALSHEIALRMAGNGAPADQVYISSQQLRLIERMGASLPGLFIGGQGAVEAADRFARDAALYGRVLNGLLNGDEEFGIARVTDVQTVEMLKELVGLFEVNRPRIWALLEWFPKILEVADAAQEMMEQSEDFYEILAGFEM